MYRLLNRGSIARTTASTDMNRVSSRSHAIFSVILKQNIPDDQDNNIEKRLVSKFHFVDLAGSERVGADSSTVSRHCNISNYCIIAQTHECSRRPSEGRDLYQHGFASARQCNFSTRRRVPQSIAHSIPRLETNTVAARLAWRQQPDAHACMCISL